VGITPSVEAQQAAHVGGAREADGIPSSVDGTIPYRLKIGVTGHRQLPEGDALGRAIDHVLTRIREISPASAATRTHFAVISALAEGADRVVARAVLQEPGATLEVPLPMPRHEYMEDFEGEESRAEFERLLGQAGLIVTMQPGETREEAYERAGHYVVDRCDVLIALWDGLPARGQGGTADIVVLARERGVPLFWVHTDESLAVIEEPGNGIALEAFKKLDAYNRIPLDAAPVQTAVARQTAQIEKQFQDAGLDATFVCPFCGWILPYFVRADLLALRNQAWFYRFGAAIFYLAAAAVGAVALQKLFFSTQPWIAVIEVGFMLILLAILFGGRKLELHDRWLSYRFLSEHFRTRLFLAIAGVRTAGESANQEALPQEWLSRATEEVWSERPLTEVPPHHAEALKTFLIDAWIRDQLLYQRRASDRSRTRFQRIARASALIFGLTLIAAFLHTIGVGSSGDKETFLGSGIIFLSLTLPALAGAVRGVAAQREYERTADRCAQMVRLLETLQRRMERAVDLQHIRAVARETETVMLSENRDWFVVMQFHDFELHV
jgi:hypothetical protein